MAARSRPKKSSSVLKRIRQAKKRQVHNRMAKSKLRTLAKKLEESISSNNKDEAKKYLHEAIKAFDKAASKGILHKNTSARKISRLTIRFNAMVKPEAA
ncbi:MAG: 30S ribosomal protein S20 [Nitrospirae bacterium]|nr:30S ribosomal protein S20 [Nitrospirota bacterium]